MMEIASANYMPELGMEDPTFFHQYPMDSFACPFEFDNFDFHSFSESPESDYSFHEYFNSESTLNCFPVESTNQSVAPTRPTKKLKTLSNTIPKPSSSSPSAKLISFGNFNAPSIASQQFHNLRSDLKPKLENECNENTDFAALVSRCSYEDKIFSNYDNRANQVARNPVQAQEHVIAERKRREKLTRSFIALSAIVPGLKKMDKASVLGDAIKYVKELQERVQTLEDQAAKKKVGSAVLVKRSILFTDDDNSTSDDSNCDQPLLPEMEVRVSSKDVLIKIQCDKRSGVATVLGELEKHNLTVHSSSFLPFGNNIVDVTIVAQMNKENCVTAKDLLRSLRQTLRQSI